VKRREFITLVGGAAAAWPVAARAQQPAMPVVGFLNVASPDGYRPMVAAFRQGLKESGYVEDRNVAIEFCWAGGRTDRLPAMAAELVHRQVSVIAATSTPAALAARAAITTIPIVFETGGDPVKLGLVVALNQPGGNVTGVSQLNAETMAKRLQLLHEMVPTATSFALLLNPINPALAELLLRSSQAAAQTLGLSLHVLYAGTESDFDGVFANVIQLRAGGLVIASDALFTSQLEQLAALALRHAVPTIYEYREFVAAGGLAAYSGGIVEAYRLTGIYAGRILDGKKPDELPVQQVTRIEMFLNLKTATALGITVPLPLLGRADEVIE
jgi:putative tryptophan/tyrosine transport system substrate-binding protein